MKNKKYETKKIHKSKWLYGSILVFAYFAFFIWQAEVQMGVLPLVVVTMGWGWLFYKATDININNITPYSKNKK